MIMTKYYVDDIKGHRLYEGFDEDLNAYLGEEDEDDDEDEEDK